MSLILNIETATKNCSVSLSNKGELLAIKELNDINYSHGENLHIFIDEIMKVSKVIFSELSAIAVSKGPGSYTGLRIGVSTAKGLCFALDKPLISIPTLTSLAHAISVNTNDLIVPMLDARRMEVYSAVFNSKHHQIRETKAEIIDKDSFSELLVNRKIYFLGDGSEKCKEVIKHDNAVFLENYFPSAEEMSKLSFEKYKKNDIEDVAYFEPYYLKDFLVTKPKN